MRFDGIGNHLRAAQTDFFLHRVDDVKRIGECDIIYFQQACEYDTPVMGKIRVFMRDHVAAAVAEGVG